MDLSTVPPSRPDHILQLVEFCHDDHTPSPAYRAIVERMVRAVKWAEIEDIRVRVSVDADFDVVLTFKHNDQNVSFIIAKDYGCILKSTGARLDYVSREHTHDEALVVLHQQIDRMRTP